MMNHSKEWLVDRINDLEDSARDMLMRIDSMQWQSIETAPKLILDDKYHDVTCIVTDGISVGICVYATYATGAIPSRWFAWSDCGDIRPNKITHWMPLPAPPTA